MSVKSVFGVAVATVSILAGRGAVAQSGGGAWEFTIAPYLVAAAMDGTVTVKGLEADVDVPFETIVENLDMAAMVHFEMRNDRWMLSSDVVYMDLEGTSEAANGTATTSVSETLFEVVGGYRVSPGVTLLAGARLVDLGTGVSFTGPNLERGADVSKSWVDPLVGVHVVAPLSERWWIGAHGDIGGFGVGAELA
jgi:hypothetical protein